jgi:hypothetical protein
VAIILPLNVSGIASDSVVAVKGMSLTIEGGDGFRWESQWLPQYELQWADTAHWNPAIIQKRNTFEREASTPVDVHISFALTHYREEDERTAISTTEEFRLPGTTGQCALPSGRGNVRCRSPFTMPRLIATVDGRKISCPLGPGAVPHEGRATVTEANWEAGSDELEPGIDPIATFRRVFSSYDSAKNTTMFWDLCPGTPITLLTPKFEGRSRVELDAKAIKLADYEYRYGVLRSRLTTR